MLGISPVSLVDSRMSSVSVMMGLTKNIGDVLANTAPMNLFPGSHLCGGVRRRLRTQFWVPSLASFEILSVGERNQLTKAIKLILSALTHLFHK